MMLTFIALAFLLITNVLSLESDPKGDQMGRQLQKEDTKSKGMEMQMRERESERERRGFKNLFKKLKPIAIGAAKSAIQAKAGALIVGIFGG